MSTNNDDTTDPRAAYNQPIPADQRWLPKNKRVRRLKHSEEFPPMIQAALEHVVATNEQLVVPYQHHKDAINLRKNIYAFRGALRREQNALWMRYNTTYVSDPQQLADGTWQIVISPSAHWVMGPLTQALLAAMAKKQEEGTVEQALSTLQALPALSALQALQAPVSPPAAPVLPSALDTPLTQPIQSSADAIRSLFSSDEGEEN